MGSNGINKDNDNNNKSRPKWWIDDDQEKKRNRAKKVALANMGSDPIIGKCRCSCWVKVFNFDKMKFRGEERVKKQ